MLVRGPRDPLVGVAAWPTDHGSFVEHAGALLTVPEPITVLGIDEATPWQARWVRNDDPRTSQHIMDWLEASAGTA